MKDASVFYSQTSGKIRQKAISYVYAGALKRTPEFRDDLIKSVRATGTLVHVISWADALERPWPELLAASNGDARLAVGHVVLLWRPDAAMSHPQFETSLQSARPFSQSCIQAGANVAIVSNIPAASFAPIDGSSLFIDAGPIGVPPVNEESILLANPSLSREAAGRICSRAWGSPALAELYVDIENAADSSNAKMRRSKKESSRIISLAISELPIAAQARLESLVLDFQFDGFDEESLTQLDAAHLLSSGLLVDPMDDGTYRLACAGLGEAGENGLIDSLSRITEAPREWQLLANALFRLERLCRRVLWLHFTNVHGADWQIKGLGDSLKFASSIAARDGNVEDPEKLAMPLDWLSLGQLLSLAVEATGESGVSIGGLSHRDFVRMQRRALPVRNRFAHMRLPRPTDLEDVLRSTRILAAAEVTLAAAAE